MIVFCLGTAQLLSSISFHFLFHHIHLLLFLHHIHHLRPCCPLRGPQSSMLSM